ncbi:MAG: hypothetical protein ACI8ZO_000908 [Flavobacteriales bacterium]|jgi:hypothetical protein
MKKILLSIGLLAGAFGMANAQTFVSTDPSNRNAVLEEYTGFTCTFCPDGHRRANAFAEANPDRALLINIHAGGYANPGNSGFDLRTSFGEALANQTNLAGYPAGTMNRQEFQGLQQNGTGTAMGRANWTTAGSQILALPSPLNIAAQASLDIETRTLTVDVEAYYTGDAAEATNFINVALLQDYIVGPQIDAGTQVPDYEHNHVLRHLLTGQWGDEITTTTSGSFVSKQYTYVLPNTIGSELVNISNLEIAVFMTETTQEIITGSATDVELTNFQYQTDLASVSLEVPSSTCVKSISPVLTIQNNGANTITTAEIGYEVNWEGQQTYTWNGSLDPFSEATVELPEINFTNMFATNHVSAVVLSANNIYDNYWDNNFAFAEFIPASAISVDQLIVTMNTDQYGEETSWVISDANGAPISSGGITSAYGANTTYIDTVDISLLSCFTFEVFDEFGDGMCCDFGNGSYTVSDLAGNLLVSGGSFTQSESYSMKHSNVGIADITTVKLNLYPNPTNNSFSLNLDAFLGQEAEIRLFNSLGKMVDSQTVQANGIHTVDVSSLSNGIYSVQVSSGSFNSVSKVSVLK